MNGMGLSLSEICCLFCCPPCPSRIAAKLAFLPPEPTYSFQVCSLHQPLVKPLVQSYSQRGKYSLTGSDFHLAAWPAPLSSRDRKYLLHTSGCLAGWLPVRWAFSLPASLMTRRSVRPQIIPWNKISSWAELLGI